MKKTVTALALGLCLVTAACSGTRAESSGPENLEATECAAGMECSDAEKAECESMKAEKSCCAEEEASTN